MTREIMSERKENMGKEPKELAQLGVISNDQIFSSIKSNRKWDGGGGEYVYICACLYMYAFLCIYFCVYVRK